MRDRYDKFKTADPGGAKNAVLSLRKPDGAPQQAQRDFGTFDRIVSEHERCRQSKSTVPWIKCDKKEFQSHWKGRGRSKASIKKRWAKATAPEKFRKNLAWNKEWRNRKGKKKKKKTIVWVKCQGTYDDSDIVSTKLRSKTGEMKCDPKAAEKQMFGKSLEHSRPAKASLGPGTF